MCRLEGQAEALPQVQGKGLGVLLLKSAQMGARQALGLGRTALMTGAGTNVGLLMSLEGCQTPGLGA